MTDYEKIILVITAVTVLLVLIFTIINFILQVRHKSPKQDFSALLYEVEKVLNNSTLEMYTKINSNLTEQLVKSNNISQESWQSLSEKLSRNIADFQEKTTDKLNQAMKNLTTSIDQNINNINQKVEDRLSKGFQEANNTFIKIAERVEVIDSAQKNIEELSKEMVSLQNILSNNQARGTYGEYQLNQLLRVVYGEYDNIYKMQYSLKSDDENYRVDAIINLPEPHGMIAIDSKFPFSKYSEIFDQTTSSVEEDRLVKEFAANVKKHINDIAKKYILPGITTDYALMFVPSDGILAFLHAKLKNVIDYSREKNITICSPTTLVPLLSSFKAFIIDYEKNKFTKEINNQLLKLRKDFRIFSEEWIRLTNSVDSLKKHTDNFNKRVEKINDKFEKIDQIGINQESSQNHFK
jgi:DNA recombination protein RmuC